MPLQHSTATNTLFLSVVVPCYNEKETLGELYRRITAVCSSYAPHYELVLVNDGSRDRTWSVMQELAEMDSHIVAVNLSRNHGHQLALTAGLDICRGERILVLDADLQDPPELLPEMMRLMDQGVDVVYGQRISRKAETLFKRFTAFAFYRILSFLSDVEIPSDTGDFRLISRRVLNILISMPEAYRYIRGMVTWVGFRQEPIRFERQKRFAGVSKYPLFSMIRFALNAITSFSIRPLRLASILGLVSCTLTLVAIVYIIVGYFQNHTVVGWTSLMVAILFFSSVQLLSLGIIGEYLGRLFIEQKRRPLFLIQEVVRHPRNASFLTGDNIS